MTDVFEAYRAPAGGPVIAGSSEAGGWLALVVALVIRDGGAMQGGVPETIEAGAFVPKDREGEIPAVPGDRDRSSHRVCLRSLDESRKRLDVGTRMGDAIVRFHGKVNRVRFPATVPARGDGAVLVRDEANKTIFQPAPTRDVGVSNVGVIPRRRAGRRDHVHVPHDLRARLTVRQSSVETAGPEDIRLMGAGSSRRLGPLD